jgi:hypothetical protein
MAELKLPKSTPSSELSTTSPILKSWSAMRTVMGKLSQGIPLRASRSGLPRSRHGTKL